MHMLGCLCKQVTRVMGGGGVIEDNINIQGSFLRLEVWALSMGP